MKPLFAALLLIACAPLALSSLATSQVLLSFDGQDGTYPVAGVTLDSAGNLYGTTLYGSDSSNYGGEVFELIPNTNGGWTEKVLHGFGDDSSDGAFPGAAVILDSSGHIFGTSAGGGSFGYGTVFELSPSAAGTWRETIIYNFDFTDGSQPVAQLLSYHGNLYGTSEGGGTALAGTAFELSPSSDGPWTHTILHSFGNDPNDGNDPVGALVADSAGNLYGTTLQGGGTPCEFGYGCGTVFELSPSASGWTEKIIYTFKDSADDGFSPEAAVVFDSAGNLFGTTTKGGAASYGTVFELSPQGDGTWAEKIIYNFTGDKGRFPVAGLTRDASGNFYGTTDAGGTHDDGTIFELTPVGTGWKETVLHNFSKANGDGVEPLGGITFDAHGNLYTTTQYGGTFHQGTVFEIPHTKLRRTPPAAGEQKSAGRMQ